MVQTVYDIVTKGHGGVPIAIRTKAETKEVEGTTFIIELAVVKVKANKLGV